MIFVYWGVALVLITRLIIRMLPVLIPVFVILAIIGHSYAPAHNTVADKVNAESTANAIKADAAADKWLADYAKSKATSTN